MATPAYAWTELARTRRSVRRYEAAPIDAATLDRILTAATWAPSAHNRQPWRFAIVDRPQDRLGLARVMGRRLRADRLAHGDDPDAVAADVARSQARLAEAPCLVVACLSMVDMDGYPDASRQQAEYLMAVQSTAMAVQTLLLAACGENLSSCVMCAPLFCADGVVEALGLPHDWRPQSLIALGRPSGPAKTRDRKPLREVSLRVVGVDEEERQR